MHALSQTPRLSVIAVLLLVHQAEGYATDRVQTTDEVVMAKKGFGGRFGECRANQSVDSTLPRLEALWCSGKGITTLFLTAILRG